MKYHSIKLAIRFVFTSVAVCLASCFHDENLPIVNIPNDGYLPLTVGAEITQENITRVNNNGFADGDKIGVYIVNYKDGEPLEFLPSGNHADNVRFEYNEEEGTWTGAYQIYWNDKVNPIDAYGYYPFDQDIKNVNAYPFTIQRNQNNEVGQTNMLGYEASDFLWAKCEKVYPSAGTINLKHKHIMAGVQITLVEGYGFEKGEWESITKNVQIDNTYLTSTINLQSGEVMIDNSTSVEAIIPMGSGTEYRAIVLPQVVEAGKSLISLNIDGRSLFHKLDYDMTYYPNKLHKFTLEVIKSLEKGDYELSLLTESIVPWESDSVSHNGIANEYIHIHVEEGEYIGDVVARMGIDPKEIINLKLSGTLSNHDHFGYIRKNMPYLEAVNLRDLRTKNQTSFYWEGDGTPGNGWGVPPYNQPISADDYIPRGAFENMIYLSYVVWPEHLVGIGDTAFAGCNLRGSLILPEGLKHIGGSAFEAYGHQSSSLTGEIYLPTTLEYIGGGAFDPADSKKNNLVGEFILPPNIKYIGGGAFGPCHLMTGRVHIPDGWDVIEGGALPENLTGDVFIPQSVKVVNGLPKKITSVHFSEGVQEIGYLAIAGIKTLTGDIELPSSITKIGNNSFAEINISHVKLSENLTRIPQYAFFSCRYLQDTLTIPSKVQYIDMGAFQDCRMLAAVKLSENLERIDERAFSGCHSLEYVECMAKEPPTLHPSGFDGVEKNNISLVVPAESVEAYKNAENWKEFKRITSYRNFVCRPMQGELLNKGSVRNVVLNADGYWEITHSPDWARASVTSGYKKTQFDIEIDDLEHGAGMRRDSIVFTLKDVVDEDGNPIRCSYNIRQYDYEHEEDSEICVQKATKGNNGGINITFVGDGFSAKDITEGLYEEKVLEGVEHIFSIEPYKTYREYFNVNIDFALSYESGVCSHVNIWRDTKFDSTYGARDGRLKVYDDAVTDYILNDVDNGAITADNINESLVICLLNTDVWEGVTTLYSTGAAIAFLPHCGDNKDNFRGLMQHEACGHGFGKLADEYIYHNSIFQTCHCTCCGHVDEVLFWQGLGWYRNISLSGKYSDIEWRHLIFHENYDEIVDIFEGGYYHLRGVYRSEVNSCMNNNVPYFSTISRQAIVERIKQYAGEEFSFNDFVKKDNKEWGEYTRAQLDNNETMGHSSAPIIINGSPVDNIKTK